MFPGRPLSSPNPPVVILRLLLAACLLGQGAALSATPKRKIRASTQAVKKENPADVFQKLLANRAGVVERTAAPKRARGVVIHLMDIHGDEPAQRTLGETLNALVKAGADLVALEGAFAALDVEGFRNAVDAGARQKTADFLLAENRISGPLHAALTALHRYPPLEGIDEYSLYRQNVEAARRSARERAAPAALLKDSITALQTEKERVFGPSLLSFDRTLQKTGDGAVRWTDRIRALTEIVGDRDFPAVREYLRLADVPTDEARLGREARRLATLLGSALSAIEKEALESPAGASPEVLENMLSERGFSLSQEAPLLAERAARTAALAKIPTRKLMQEAQRLEERAIHHLARTAEERAIVQRDRDLRLCAALVDARLSPSEWSTYKSRRRAPDYVSPLPDAALAPFEAFYENAESRDHALLRNFLAAIETRHASRPVIVTGGFHADRLRERLSEAGWTVLSFIPRPGGGAGSPADPFSREPTLMDQMAAGDFSALNIDLSPEGGWLHRATVGALAVREAESAGDRPAEEESRLARRILGPAVTSADAQDVGPGRVRVDLTYRGRLLTHDVELKTGGLDRINDNETSKRRSRVGAYFDRPVFREGGASHKPVSPGAASRFEWELWNALDDRFIESKYEFDLVGTFLGGRLLTPRFAPRPSRAALKRVRETMSNLSIPDREFANAALAMLADADPKPLLALESSPPPGLSPAVFAVFLAQAHTLFARLNDRNDYLYGHHMGRALDWWDESARADPGSPWPDLYRALAALDGTSRALAAAEQTENEVNWVNKIAQFEFQPGEIDADAFWKALRAGRPVDVLILEEAKRRPADSPEELLNGLRKFQLSKELGTSFSEGLPERLKKHFLREKKRDGAFRQWNFAFLVEAYAEAIYDVDALREGKQTRVREKAIQGSVSRFLWNLRHSHARAAATARLLERLLLRTDLTPNQRLMVWGAAIHLAARVSFSGRYRLGVREGWPETVDSIARDRLRDLSRRALTLVGNTGSADPRFTERRAERADQLFAGFLEDHEFFGMPIEELWDIFQRLARFMSTEYLLVFMRTDSDGNPTSDIGRDPASWRLAREVLAERLSTLGSVDLSRAARLHPSLGAPFRQRARDLLPVFVADLEHDLDGLFSRQDNLYFVPGRVRHLKDLVELTSDLSGPGTGADFNERLTAALAENGEVEKEAVRLLKNQQALLEKLREETKRVKEGQVSVDRSYRRSLRGALVASDFASFPDTYHSFTLTREDPIEGLLAAREDLIEALRSTPSSSGGPFDGGRRNLKAWWNAATRPVRSVIDRLRRGGDASARVWTRWRGGDDPLVRDAQRLAALLGTPLPRPDTTDVTAPLPIDNPGLAERVLTQASRRGLGRFGVVLRRELQARGLDQVDAARVFDALARAVFPVPADRLRVKDADAPAPRPVHLVFINDASGLEDAKRLAADFTALHRNKPGPVLLLVRADSSLPTVPDGLDPARVRWVQPEMSQDGRVFFASLSDESRRALADAGWDDRPLRWRAVNAPPRGLAGLDAAANEDIVVEALREAILQALKNAPLYTLQELSNLLRVAQVIATNA